MSLKFEGWAILEVMGHRRLGGYVTEATIAGGAFIRIDVPSAGSDGVQPNPDTSGAAEGASVYATQFYSPSSVFCLTPTTEATARAVAKLSQPAPVQQWELPQLRGREDDRDEDEFADEEEESPL